MFREAIAFAARAHSAQKRKDGDPYIVHPVTVAFILAQNGASEPLVCAGLLHDTVEDAAASPEELERRFGREVAHLVCFDSEDKSRTWEERKETVFETLETSGSRDYKMLMCADKLANLQDVEQSLKTVGEDVWKGFKRGRDKQEWFYRRLVRTLSDLEGLEMYDELKRTVERVF